MEIVIDRRYFRYPQYIYSKVIFEPISFFNFEGKNLEQIKQEYGKEISSAVYWSACHGNNKKIQPPQCKKEDVIELDVKKIMETVKIFLKANTYTEAKEDMCISKIKLQSPQISKDIIWQIVKDLIYKLEKNNI